MVLGYSAILLRRGLLHPKAPTIWREPASTERAAASCRSPTEVRKPVDARVTGFVHVMLAFSRTISHRRAETSAMVSFLHRQKSKDSRAAWKGSESDSIGIPCLLPPGRLLGIDFRARWISCAIIDNAQFSSQIPISAKLLAQNLVIQTEELSSLDFPIESFTDSTHPSFTHTPCEVMIADEPLDGVCNVFRFGRIDMQASSADSCDLAIVRESQKKRPAIPEPYTLEACSPLMPCCWQPEDMVPALCWIYVEATLHHVSKGLRDIQSILGYQEHFASSQSEWRYSFDAAGPANARGTGKLRLLRRERAMRT